MKAEEISEELHHQSKEEENKVEMTDVTILGNTNLGSGVLPVVVEEDEDDNMQKSSDSIMQEEEISKVFHQQSKEEEKAVMTDITRDSKEDVKVDETV